MMIIIGSIIGIPAITGLSLQFKKIIGYPIIAIFQGGLINHKGSKCISNPILL